MPGMTSRDLKREEWLEEKADNLRRQVGRLFSVEFNKRLLRYFGRRGMYQFAQQCNIPYSSVYQIRHSLALPGEVKLRRICTALKWDYKEAVALFPDGRVPHRGWPAGLKRVEKWKSLRLRFGRIVAEWKKATGIEDSDFCARAKISFPYYKAIQAGRVGMPSFPVLERIASVLGRNPWRLKALRLASMAPVKDRAEVLERLIPSETELIKEARKWDVAEGD